MLRAAARVLVVSRCVRGIDARGLHKTNLAALRDAASGVSTGLGGDVLCLIDGFAVPDFGRPQRAIVEGDATSAAIAAASIVAKVSGTATCSAPTRATPAGASASTSATRRPRTARRSSATASRRCTGCPSSRSAYQQLAL